MRSYQTKYIENLKKIAKLADPPSKIPEDIDSYISEHNKANIERFTLAAENTELLRANLIPVLDDIVSAKPAEISELQEFATQLSPGAKQLDLILCYIIHNALVVYARKWNLRDMLIEELYYTGLALFYMHNRIVMTGKRTYDWKLSMMFGEAAAYLKKYEELENEETRGYVIRSVANLALASDDPNIDLAAIEKKAEIIRRGMSIITDPYYRNLSPNLPWDAYVYKYHQERTSLMMHIDAGYASPKIIGEIMESAEYVWNQQKRQSEEKGTAPMNRWRVVYERALYHCGIQPLSSLLEHMEKIYLARDEKSYDINGIYTNIRLICEYVNYIKGKEELERNKKPIIAYMYRRMIDYVRNAPNNGLGATLSRNLMECLEVYIEYPDVISYKDYVLKILMCRDPDFYTNSKLAAVITRLMMEYALENMPSELDGVRGYTADELNEHREELLEFAYYCGMLHNIGAIHFLQILRLTGRSWTGEELEMYSYRSILGYKVLNRCESTRAYALTALGCCTPYNESIESEYRRDENPDRAVTDLVAVAAYAVSIMDEGALYPIEGGKTLCDAAKAITQKSEIQFSPFAVQAFAGALDRISEYLDNGRREAAQEVFGLLRGDYTA